MSQYFMFLKNGLIDFEKLIIDQYVNLGLDEIDTLILIKLNHFLKSNKKFSTSDVATKMTLSESVIRDRLVALINNQYITLTLSGQHESYSLDDTFKRLSFLLEENDLKVTNKETDNDFKKVIDILERELKKILSPLDHEVVHHWIYQEHFTIETISLAILEALKYKKNSIKYIDLILHRQKVPVKTKPSEGIQELFTNVYNKIK